MLTRQTEVEYALLEVKRDPAFYQFCLNHIETQRAKHQLPTDFNECLAVEAAPGITLARVLLELYMAQLNQPQWLRARALSEKAPATR